MLNDDQTNNTWTIAGGYNYNNPTKHNYGDIVEIMGKKYSIALNYGKPELRPVQDRLDLLEERIASLEAEVHERKLKALQDFYQNDIECGGKVVD